MDPGENFPARTPIVVGVAGWSYPDWTGPVYGGRVGDQLRFIAGYVDVVEINNSFYRPPTARMTASWVERTHDLAPFAFTAKLHQDMTHGGRLDPASLQLFQDGFAPMFKAGMLRHWLAQFPWSFSDSPAARDHLARLRDAFAGPVNLTLELRHNSWQSPATLGFLGGLGVTVANLDYPTARTSFNLNLCTVGADAYFRLHGRNSQAWFDRTAGRNDTYNYLYNREELTGIVSRAAALAKSSKSLTIVTNNHFEGKELVNALQIKALLTGRKVAAPPALLKAYPELRDHTE